MVDALDIEEYRKLYRTLGGHPDSFQEWYERHKAWEAERAKPRDEKPKTIGKRGAKVRQK